ncbi:Uncharacterized protein (Fragment) OS=uncultured bacterium PE=4 SV=1 [Gemmataceae bacterium]
MLGVLRSYTWLHSRSPARLIVLLRGRASERKGRLLGVAVGRMTWWRLPYWLPGTEYETAIRTAVELAELVAEGEVAQDEFTAKLDRAYDAVSTLRTISHEGFLIRPVARIGTELLPLLESGALNGAGFPDIKEDLLLGWLRDIFGNPFRPVAFDPAWRTDTAVSLARVMYESRDFGAMPILADALQDAGCDNGAVLAHCRDPLQVHVRGCWVVDLVLGRE